MSRPVSKLLPPLSRLDLSDLDLSGLDRMIVTDLLACAPDPEDPGLMAILLLMMAALAEGSLCLFLSPENLESRLGQAGMPDSRDLVFHFLDRLNSGHYDMLVDRHPDLSGGILGQRFKPLVQDTIGGNELLYFQKFYFHERRLAASLDRFLSLDKDAHTGFPFSVPQNPMVLIDELYTEERGVRKSVNGPLITRDTDQVEAILAVLKAPLVIISGGPGTGKTTLLVNILRALARCGADPARMVLAAPTGRAAQRMTESLSSRLSTILQPDPKDLDLMRLSGATLHKILHYSPRTGGFLHHAEHPIPADVIVVDEVSMVDVVMMDRFFQAVDPHRTRVILLGDKDQLPSVEAGAVLSALDAAAGVESGSEKGRFSGFVTLKTVYRAEGRLVELSGKINAGDPIWSEPLTFDQAMEMTRGQWAFVPAGDLHALETCLHHWIGHHYGVTPTENKADDTYVNGVSRLLGSSESLLSPTRQAQLKLLFRLAGRSRILTLLREGPLGTRQINAFIAAVLRARLDPAAHPESPLFSGNLILVTRNDYKRGLFNGDVGLVLRGADGAYGVYFERSGKFSVFPASTLPDWEPAFAMTVHKSQGSEFEDTWLILPDDPGHRLLTREIIYTAVTRAARRLILYGKKEVLQAALERKIHRQTGLWVEWERGGRS
ncbi:exodeoxyribonuclease V subunit alpha [Desulfosarcina sp. OttesenSCG-928-A07]|nr:exodeoxyribonuclease V subunit alpha [Desulfosarcina sp. OttesenSCG-928-G17]MDL2329836.1 exodeoxyribonuclease V subunit alpha [Desulfosarcina sp. OttesenSCG-928-A07]